VERESSANCDREVATDRWASTTESREADRSRASGPPLSSEGRVSRMRRTPLQEVVAGPSAEQDSGAQRPNGPARRRKSRLSVKPNMRVEVASLEPHKFARFCDVDGAPVRISAL
jgi:hypothetical protein